MPDTLWHLCANIHTNRSSNGSANGQPDQSSDCNTDRTPDDLAFSVTKCVSDGGSISISKFHPDGLADHGASNFVAIIEPDGGPVRFGVS